MSQFNKNMLSLFDGISSLFNVFGVSPYDLIPSHSDSEAIRSDWERVGMDIATAINKYEEQ